MTEFFNRRVSVEVLPEAGQGFLWDGLRTSFRVEYASARKPAKARIAIYNQTVQSRKFIKELGETVVLQAGYENIDGQIFSGDIQRATPEHTPPDIITRIEAGDGERAISERRVAIAFGPGRTTGDMFTELVNSLGLDLGDISEFTPRVLESPTVLEGPVSLYLDQLADELNADWWTADGALHFVLNPGPALTTQIDGLSSDIAEVRALIDQLREEAGPALELGAAPEDIRGRSRALLDQLERLLRQRRRLRGESQSAEIVSPDTGLVGSPQELTKQRSGRTRVVGVKWRMLLRPDARPAKLYELQAREFEGLYTARRVILTGDSGFDRAFYAEVEARAAGER